ncbi:MAG: TolC family protein [Nitrospirae bacterium]|nr:MAG: TolC family protein [Nitrospirota bacterium]
MRHWVTSALAIIMATFLGSTAWGQSVTPKEASPTLTLQEAIQTALRIHPALQSSEFAVQGAEARAKQAESPYYPQIGGTAIQTNGSVRTNALFSPSGSLIEPNRSDFSVGVSARQTVYDFGQTSSKVDAQRSDRARFEKDAVTRRMEIVLGVERAYFSVLKRKRLVEIAEQTVRERGVLKLQIEVLYRNQLKSKLDLGLIQVQLSDAEYLVIRARNDLIVAFADLNNAMGVEGSAMYSLEDLPVAVEPPRAIDALVGEAMDRRPELLSLKERMRTAEHRVKAAGNTNFPTIQVVGSAGDTEHISNRPNLQEGGWWAVGGVVSVPLFTGFLIQNQVAEATAQQRETEAIYRTVAQNVQLQVKDSYLDVVTLLPQIKVAEQQVLIAREALSLASQRYKLGLSSIVEVTQSEVAVTSAETRLAETQYNAKIAEARLRYAVGGI